jgi:hypothetical protein
MQIQTTVTRHFASTKIKKLSFPSVSWDVGQLELLYTAVRIINLYSLVGKKTGSFKINNRLVTLGIHPRETHAHIHRKTPISLVQNSCRVLLNCSQMYSL